MKNLKNETMTTTTKQILSLGEILGYNTLCSRGSSLWGAAYCAKRLNDSNNLVEIGELDGCFLIETSRGVTYSVSTGLNTVFLYDLYGEKTVTNVFGKENGWELL